MQKKIKQARRTIKSKEERIEKMLQQSLNHDDEDIGNEVEDIIKEYGETIKKMPTTDMKRIFWEQQVCTIMHIHACLI